jgi:hypothetical protein
VPTPQEAIHKLDDQISAVTLAVGVSPMQPIVDTLFDCAALLAGRNGRHPQLRRAVRWRRRRQFLRRSRCDYHQSSMHLRSDAHADRTLARQLWQTQEKPATPSLTAAAEGISSY